MTAPIQLPPSETSDSATPLRAVQSANPDDQEHFIPLDRLDLVDLLCEHPDLSDRERDLLEKLCRLLESIFHFEYHQNLRSLLKTYAPLDPDLSTSCDQAEIHAKPEASTDSFFQHLTHLLDRANYRQLTRDDLLQAVGAASAWGINLHVDFDMFQRLEVYVRGDDTHSRPLRRLRNWYRREFVDVPVYQRLIVAFRVDEHACRDNTVNSDFVYIKIFKEIPKMDVDMLLPGTRVKMTLLDQGKILIPTISGVLIGVTKFVKAFLLATLAGIYGMLALLGLLGGTLGYGIKSFFGYLRTKDKYQLHLTRHLYYQNLDNNAGVLFRLLNEAEQQEYHEAILAYFFLWKQCGSRGCSLIELDQKVESYLNSVLGANVNFEVEDALAKLKRLGLASQNRDGNWQSVPPETALRTLDHCWDNYFQFAWPATKEGDRPQ